MIDFWENMGERGEVDTTVYNRNSWSYKNFNKHQMLPIVIDFVWYTMNIYSNKNFVFFFGKKQKKMEKCKKVWDYSSIETS